MLSKRNLHFISNPNHKENLSGRVTQACPNCRRKKIKCGGQIVCRQCQEKDLMCEGPTSRKRPTSDGFPDSGKVLDHSTHPYEALTASQDASGSTFQRLHSSKQPSDLRPSSNDILTMPALPDAGLVGAPSGFIYPMPLQRLPQQHVLAPALERGPDNILAMPALLDAEAIIARQSGPICPLPFQCPPDHPQLAPALERSPEEGPSRSPDHLVQEAAVLEGKASWLRRLAMHRRQSIDDDAAATRSHDYVQKQRGLPLSSSTQPRSQPSNPNQLAFGVASPALKTSSGQESWPSILQYCASTISPSDDVTLRTGLTSRGGASGSWDRVDIQQPSYSPFFGPQQPRLDFDTPASCVLQRQQQESSYVFQQQCVSSSRTGKPRTTQGSDGHSSSNSSSTSSSPARSTGPCRMQAAFRTELLFPGGFRYCNGIPAS
ncbi:hypothetical protein LTS10_009386 [Elasticomyces elasticus]|nr:hypothetical protein LTS10_009386 [Elasticomyces elasticus]